MRRSSFHKSTAIDFFTDTVTHRSVPVKTSGCDIRQRASVPDRTTDGGDRTVPSCEHPVGRGPPRLRPRTARRAALTRPAGGHAVGSAMRIMFCTRPAYGHVYPLMPLAEAAREPPRRRVRHVRRVSAKLERLGFPSSRLDLDRPGPRRVPRHWRHARRRERAHRHEGGRRTVRQHRRSSDRRRAAPRVRRVSPTPWCTSSTSSGHRSPPGSPGFPRRPLDLTQLPAARHAAPHRPRWYSACGPSTGCAAPRRSTCSSATRISTSSRPRCRRLVPRRPGPDPSGPVGRARLVVPTWVGWRSGRSLPHARHGGGRGRRVQPAIEGLASPRRRGPRRPRLAAGDALGRSAHVHVERSSTRRGLPHVRPRRPPRWQRHGHRGPHQRGYRRC